jgi:tRNA threonylcarbamoyladenosine biosynthesis protein TsaB
MNIEAEYILCLETSASNCSVALTHPKGDLVLAGSTDNNHAEALIPMIEQILLQAEINIKAIQAIAISAGPGSYTGLRIGASTAKGLCFGLNVPLIAINTLEALAHAAIESTDGTYDMYWPMIDARRMEVYEALYNNDLSIQRPMNNLILTEPMDLNALMDKRVLICGDAAVKAQTLLPFDANTDIKQHARYLLPLSKLYFERSQFADLTAFEPDYLKFANITSSKKRF